jgi:solute carrier family 25 protein 38
MQVLPKSNPTIRAAMISIWQERGLVGFFAGSTLRISRKAASSAIGWTVYEGLLLALRDKQII